MNITDVKTSGEAATEMKTRRARLDELSAEPDNAAWLATQGERNQLELDIRTLTQLHARLVKQEEQERVAELEAIIAESDRALAHQDDVKERLSTFVRDTVAGAVALLVELDGTLDRKRALARDVARLEMKLGRQPGVRPVPQLHNVLHRVREEIWGHLTRANATRFKDELRDLFTVASSLPEDGQHLGLLGFFARGGQPDRRFDDPLDSGVNGGGVFEVLPDSSGSPMASHVFEKPRSPRVFVHHDQLIGTTGNVIVEETEPAR
jgi:hypothetical protein